MKKWLSKLFGKILAVGENRYIHSTIGALIASIMCCALCWLPLWANIMASIIVVSGLAVYKEYGMDGKADLIDIAFTIVGGIIVILPILLINVLFIKGF